MTLSQILAKDSYYDGELEVPPKGQWMVRMIIRDGRIVNAWKEESIKKPGAKELGYTATPNFRYSDTEEKIKK